VAPRPSPNAPPAPEALDLRAERGRSDASGASAAAPLTCIRELVTLPDPRVGCGRWPERMWIVNEKTGELFRGRCRATNLCPSCAMHYTVETVEMLTLDALENAPTIWLVLTAREHLTRSQCRDHLRQLRKAARRLWPHVEWFVQVEFQRRGALHLNLLVKGVPVEDVQRFGAVLVARWCSRVDAEPQAQWIEAMNDGYGVTRYISKMLAHGMKAEQRPPIGWAGHRTSQTAGYLVRPASVMREEARASLREKRLLWKALGIAEGVAGGTPTADLVEIVYEQLQAAAADTTYSFVNHEPPAQRWTDTGRPIIPSRTIASTAPLPSRRERPNPPAPARVTAAGG